MPNGRILVLTGGPSTGKTSLIEHLSSAGHPVIREAARDVLDRPGANDRRRESPQAFQREVLNLQLEREFAALEASNGAQPVVADRGVGDHFGYLRYAGAEVFAELEAAWEDALTRYLGVLLLAPGPIYDPHGTRSESAEEAATIHQLIAEEYRLRHPRVGEIPWVPLAERQELVLAHAEQFLR